VAGAKLLVTDQMPDERREIRLKRPASHTTLDGSFLIPRAVEKMQGGVDEIESGAACSALPLAVRRESEENHEPVTAIAASLPVVGREEEIEDREVSKWLGGICGSGMRSAVREWRRKATFGNERGLSCLVFRWISEAGFAIGSLFRQQALGLDIAVAGFFGGLGRGFSEFLPS